MEHDWNWWVFISCLLFLPAIVVLVRYLIEEARFQLARRRYRKDLRQIR